MATKTFGITGGGATFAFGDQVDEADKASIGIQSVNTGSLGDVTNGFLSSLASGGANSLTSGNLTTSQNILSEAINQVSTLSGRSGRVPEVHDRVDHQQPERGLRKRFVGSV